MIILMDWIARSHQTDDMVKETNTSKYVHVQFSAKVGHVILIQEHYIGFQIGTY